MIEKHYKTINIQEYVEGDFDNPGGYQTVGSFKGLIQAPSNYNTFNNGKDISTVAGVLFCPITVHFKNKTIIEYKGQKYIISGQNTQVDGVTGIEPKQGQHAEYTLLWTQEGI